MTKSYIAEFMIQRKKGIHDLQKIVLDSFPRNFSIRNAIMNDACKPKKIKDDHHQLSGSCDFTTYFHFRGVARATFARNLILSADGYDALQVFSIRSRAHNTTELKIRCNFETTLTSGEMKWMVQRAPCDFFSGLQLRFVYNFDNRHY